MFSSHGEKVRQDALDLEMKKTFRYLKLILSSMTVLDLTFKFQKSLALNQVK
jgi:hypothetical protein